MDGRANTVSILSDDPVVAEVSDCLSCGAQVAADTPWYENGSPRAMARYRLCPACLRASLYALLVGGHAQARWEAELLERLTVIGEALARRSRMIDTMRAPRRSN